MAYTAPTVADFLERFPEFEEFYETEAAIQRVLTEANRSVDETWMEEDYAPAIMYLAAHLFTVNMAAVDAVGQEAIKAFSIGPLSITYGEAVSFNVLTSTTYGQAYQALLKRNIAPVLLVI